jgi:hypothetical protein
MNWGLSQGLMQSRLQSSIQFSLGNEKTSKCLTFLVTTVALGRLNWRPTFDRFLDLVAHHRCLCG